MAIHAGTKAWALVKIGWEYDDEYYFRPECGGGTPVKVFLDKEAAEAECANLNYPAVLEATKNAHVTDRGYWSVARTNTGMPCLPYEVVEVEFNA